MTTTIVLANANDGFLTSGSPTNWDDTLNGNALAATNGATTNYYGADYAFGVWWAYQTFLQFDYTRPANEIEVAVDIGVLHATHDGAQSRQMQMLFLGTGTGLGAWGPPVDTGDWVNPLGAAFFTTRGVRVFDVQASATSHYVWAGSNLLTQRVRTYGTLSYQFAVMTDRQLIYGLYPGSAERSSIWSAESSSDPVMVVSSVPVSTLYEVAGAQVQLSDGAWAVIESDGALAPSLVLRWVSTGGVVSTIAALSGFNTGVSAAGSQQVTLTVDAADNLYVTGGWTSTNSIGVQAFAKGAGHTWSARTPLAGALPYSEAEANNFAVAWHSVGNGTLVAMVARGSSDGWHVASTEHCWVVMSGAAALAGSGTLIRSSGSATGSLTPVLSPTSWATPANETGSNLDVTALSPTKGIVHTLSRQDRLGVRQPSCKGRYILDATGTTIASYLYDLTIGTAGATWAVKTASGKLRIVPLSEDTFAVASADTVGGITVGILRASGSSPLTTLGWVLLGNESIPSMPAANVLAESQAWDIAYFPGANKLWVYYLDSANSRHILRTSINLTTNLATRDSVDVGTIGAAGSVILGLRGARGGVANRSCLLTAAVRASGGALSTIYVPDKPNEAPLAPTLTTRSNFDATQTAVFAWTFNDPDGFGVRADTQTGYQLDINTSLGVDAYDSGLVTSTAHTRTLPANTLTNPGAWQWRVRTYDETNTAGAWSAYQTFSTAAGGTVTVTDPAVDNPANVITSTYPVSWSLAGATQAAYRVVVKVHASGVEVYNSGWVTSTVTTHVVSGLTSDVVHRIEVTTRTAGAVESNTGTRLITASYSTPDPATISVLPHDGDGYTLIAVNNPPTTGDRPDVAHNEIRRRIEATATTVAGPWVGIGATSVGGSWKDYTAASGVTYEYQAVAVATDGSYQLSPRVDGTLCLGGIWIHDPEDPANASASVQHYVYGWQGKSDDIEVTAEGIFYAGREYPVYDWGEHTTETLTVPIQIPSGDTWLADVTAIRELPRQRRTLCVRDARGRRIFGAISKVTRNDEKYGTSADFTITAVDHVEEYLAYGPRTAVVGDGPDADDGATNPSDWDGGGILGGSDSILDGGDVCGGDPVCVGDTIADGGGA